MTVKTILKYLYDQVTGNFLGFLIGSSAAGLVSQFFETRSFKNLWGLTAKKTVVDKDTFHTMEWIISIVIGFIVFEIVTKVFKEKLRKNFPGYKVLAFRWIIKNNLHLKSRSAKSHIFVKGASFFAAVHQGTRQALNRYSGKN